MNFRLIILAAVLALGFAAGWLQAAPAPLGASASDVQSAVDVLHGGERAGAARERLLAAGLGKLAPEPIVEAPTAPAAPPPPDIAEVFRRALTAIQMTNDGPVVLIVDAGQARGRRSIRPGGVFKEGWRVSAISPQSVELRRGNERRSVSVFELPQSGAH